METEANRVRNVVGVLAVLVLVWTISGEGLTRAEGQGAGAQTQPRREQTTHDLRHLWNFDAEKPGQTPAGFSAGTIGSGLRGVWRVEADPQAPTAPNMLVQTMPCSSAANSECLQVLFAEGITYEYPDLAVRFRIASEGLRGGGGIVFGARDARNCYAAIVELATDTLEVVRVVDGQVTVLGHEPVKRGKTAWHLLRVQHNTILSKDFMEISFDGHIVFSSWYKYKELGAGQIGLVTRGEAVVGFDNFHAIQLFSQRPLSPPAAY